MIFFCFHITYTMCKIFILTVILCVTLPEKVYWPRIVLSIVWFGDGFLICSICCAALAVILPNNLCFSHSTFDFWPLVFSSILQQIMLLISACNDWRPPLWFIKAQLQVAHPSLYLHPTCLGVFEAPIKINRSKTFTNITINT